MAQFLKKHAKLLYILLAAFSFVLLLLACVYITPYNDTALNYNLDFLNGKITDVKDGNSTLVSFVVGLNNLGLNAKELLVFGEHSGYTALYRVVYFFNDALQKTNNGLFYLSLFSLVMVAVMLLCANGSRRKFYISNLVSGVVCPALTIIFTAVVLVLNITALVQLSSNFELINWGALGNSVVTVENGVSVVSTWFKNADTSHFELSINPLIIYSIILVLFMVANGAMIAYNVYRYNETQREFALATEGTGE